MRKLGMVAAAAVAFAAAMLPTSAGAGAHGAKAIDLSTDAAVAAYLLSIGVDSGGVVIQRGLKNYAGPFCPRRRLELHDRNPGRPGGGAGRDEHL